VERRGAHRSLWLVWVGCGVTATLNCCGVRPVLAQGAGMCCFLVWVAMNVDPTRVVWEVLYSFVDIFFREMGVRGNFVVPSSGPVIFAIAPHANQFLDPIVVGATANREDIGFITAAVTFRRRFVGRLAKWINGIPVERAQDLATAVPGRASAEGTSVTGEGTNFTALNPGGVLFLEGADPSPIAEVISDTQLTLKYPVSAPVKNGRMKVAPQVAQDGFFSTVFEALEAGRAVGVFPEGGSHDQTHFLELKPGVALFSLGGSVKIGKPVPIVPVGLNYFKGHRFRSRVFVDYGDRIYPSEELIAEYASGDSQRKREAVSKFILQIRAGLRNVTVEAPDFHSLQRFWALRRLYVPTGEKLDVSTKQALTRGFAEGYDKFKDHPKVKELIRYVDKYTDDLKQYGLRDYMVAKRMKLSVDTADQEHHLVDRMELLQLLVRRCGLLFLWGLSWIPLGCINMPFILITRYVAKKKAAEAVAKSSVKIAGRDVLATWKVLVAMGLVPAMHLIYTLLAYLMLGSLVAVLFFFFAPFLSYHNIKAQENMSRLFQSIAPLVLLLRNPGIAEQMVSLREKCRRETVEVVKEVGWGLQQFENEEIEGKMGLKKSGSFDELLME